MKNRLFIWLICMLFANYAQAQLGELRNNFAVGVNGGINMNNVSFSPTVKQNSLMGITGGLTARYISEKYFSMICGAQLEINFSQRGWDEYYEDFPDLKYTRSMNYVEIPFLAHIAFGREPRGLQFFIHAGPQIGFFLSDSETYSDNWNLVTGGVTEQHKLSVGHKFDYGIAGGAGLELRTKAGNFILEGRYYYALSDFFGNTKKDYFGRSAHMGLSIKLGYLFDITKY